MDKFFRSPIWFILFVGIIVTGATPPPPDAPAPLIAEGLEPPPLPDELVAKIEFMYKEKLTDDEWIVMKTLLSAKESGFYKTVITPL